MSFPGRRRLSIGQCGTIACAWEVAAPKPGNVHRGADFENVGLAHFLASAAAIAPSLDAAAAGEPLGRAVLSAVRATQSLAGTNTNLGTILLLVPLAKVPRYVDLTDGIPEVLANLDATDAAHVYQAIREAHAGGLGRVGESDVADTAPTDLVAAMTHAADRDLVARQYANGFHELLCVAGPWLSEEISAGNDYCAAIVRLHVRLMAEFPDSLIARKRGAEVAKESSARATAVLAARELSLADYEAALADFDFWLRSDGNARNPGTTADMVTAALFAALRDEQFAWPMQW